MSPTPNSASHKPGRTLFRLLPSIAYCLIVAALYLSPVSSHAQATFPNESKNEFTLQEAIEYAIKHQPGVQQALLDEEITASEIRSRLSDWLPQVNLNYNLQHNFLLPTNFIGGNAIKAGVRNTSAAQFTGSQLIFNRDVLLARRTKGELLLQGRQFTSRNKIDLAVMVSKAFYDLVTTAQQIKVAEENINRTQRSLRDATAQYNAGLVDKIDYKRATITLNNIRASLKSNEESVKAKTENLKSLMGFPDSSGLRIVYDSAAMERDILVDTLLVPDYRSRIEYRLLETRRQLLKANVQYNKWSFLPAVAVNAAYNFNFQNNEFPKLYNANYPNSFAGLTFSVPIFQGGRRKYNLRTSELELTRNDLDILTLRNSINADYADALAGYKSSLANYNALRENVLLATEVYDVIQLQYRSGIKTYLEVITSETDLRTAQINYFNALNQVLANKVEVQRALGQIMY